MHKQFFEEYVISTKERWGFSDFIVCNIEYSHKVRQWVDQVQIPSRSSEGFNFDIEWQLS
jgi:hypothetical protein